MDFESLYNSERPRPDRIDEQHCPAAPPVTSNVWRMSAPRRLTRRRVGLIAPHVSQRDSNFVELGETPRLDRIGTNKTQLSRSSASPLRR